MVPLFFYGLGFFFVQFFTHIRKLKVRKEAKKEKIDDNIRKLLNKYFKKNLITGTGCIFRHA